MTVVIRAKTSITDAKIVYEIAVLGKYFYQLFLNQGCEILKICKLVTMVHFTLASPTIAVSDYHFNSTSKFWKIMKMTKNTCMLYGIKWPISYRNQSINLQNRSNDWFLYNRVFRDKRVKKCLHNILWIRFNQLNPSLRLNNRVTSPVVTYWLF